MEKNLLIIFIKNPVAGEVKTRLGASIGSTNALQVYKKLLSHTREIAVQVKCDREIWYSSMIDRRDSWNSDLFEKKLQQGRNLGVRMSGAFQQAFEAGYEKAVIIGSDCPELEPQHIEDAFDALRSQDAVIGPSEDGGYYLLGMKKYTPEIFSDIEWSTSSVFEETKRHFEQLGLTCKTLEVLNDIDTIEDLKKSDLSLP